MLKLLTRWNYQVQTAEAAEDFASVFWSPHCTARTIGEDQNDLSQGLVIPWHPLIRPILGQSNWLPTCWTVFVWVKIYQNNIIYIPLRLYNILIYTNYIGCTEATLDGFEERWTRWTSENYGEHNGEQLLWPLWDFMVWFTYWCLVGNWWVAGGCWDDYYWWWLGSFPTIPCVKRTSPLW